MTVRSIRTCPASPGFTLLEVVIAIAITMAVLAAVFALLARSQSSFVVETSRADMQSQARHALERLSQDIMLAGLDLPLEFPAFTPPGVNPDLGPDGIEIIGNLGGVTASKQTGRLVRFDGRRAELEFLPAGIARGDLVLVYDGAAIEGTWTFGLVQAVHGELRELDIITAPGARVGDEASLPRFINNYNRGLPEEGYVTPVTVVTYSVDRGDGSLQRRVNWGGPQQVALVQDLQIQYFIGGTTPSLFLPPHGPRVKPGSPRDDPMGDDPRPPKKQLIPVPPVAPAPVNGSEIPVNQPPRPQPNAAVPLRLDSVVRGVQITVASSVDGLDLDGTASANGAGDEHDYVRADYSTRVAARNLVLKMTSRAETLPIQQ